MDPLLRRERSIVGMDRLMRRVSVVDQLLRRINNGSTLDTRKIHCGNGSTIDTRHIRSKFVLFLKMTFYPKIFEIYLSNDIPYSDERQLPGEGRTREVLLYRIINIKNLRIRIARCKASCSV